MKQLRFLAQLASLLLTFLPTNGFADVVAQTLLDVDGRVFRHPYSTHTYPVDLELGSGDISTIYGATGVANGIYCFRNGSILQDLDGDDDIGAVTQVEVGSTGLTAFFLGQTLYKTTDGCSNFSLIELPRVPGNAMKYAYSTLLIANSDGTISMSSDEGTSFSVITLSGSVDEVLSIAASPDMDTFFALVREDSSKTLYRSSDKGETWSAISGTLDCGRCQELAINQNDGAILAVAGRQIVRVSSDTGANWSTITPTSLRGDKARFIENRLFVGSHFTDNLGGSWQDANDTYSGDSDVVPYGELIGPVIGSGSVYYMSALRGLGQTTDGGSSWRGFQFINDGFSVYDFVAGPIKKSTSQGTAYFATNHGVYVTDEFNQDGSFNLPDPVVFGAEPPVYALLIPDKDTTSTILAGVDGGIYRSIDKGTSWTAMTINSGNFGVESRITDLAALDSTLFASYHTISAGTGGVLTSTDQGLNWSELSIPGNAPVNKLEVANGVLFAGCGSVINTNAASRGIYIYQSNSWTKVSDLVSSALITDIDSKNSLLIASSAEGLSGDVFRSQDGGQSWSSVIANGLDEGAYQSVAIDPKKNIIFAGRSGLDTKMMIYRSLDGGSSWSSYHQGIRGEVPYFLQVSQSSVEKALISGTNTAGSYYQELGCHSLYGKQGFAPFKYFLQTFITEGTHNDIGSELADSNLSLGKVKFRKNGKVVATKKIPQNRSPVTFIVSPKNGKYQNLCIYTDDDGDEVSITANKIQVK